MAAFPLDELRQKLELKEHDLLLVVMDAEKETATCIKQVRQWAHEVER